MPAGDGVPEGANGIETMFNQIPDSLELDAHLLNVATSPFTGYFASIRNMMILS